jgi:integrase
LLPKASFPTLPSDEEPEPAAYACTLVGNTRHAPETCSKAIIADNLRKTFATRLLSRGAAITDVQHLLGHASVKTTERAYAAFVKNERFKQTIDLLDKPVLPKLKNVR